jgi:hypothetical protein
VLFSFFKKKLIIIIKGTSMSVEQITEVVAAMEVVKNAKRTMEKGGKKKKKAPAAKGKATKEDFVEDEYDGFL